MTNRSVLEPQTQPSRRPNCLLWTIVGLATVAAIGILIAFTVRGIYDGRRQQEAMERQQIAIYLQSAQDYRAEGQVDLAVEVYLQVLALDPDNQEAQSGLRTLSTGLDAAMPGPAAPDPTLPLTPVATPTPQSPMEVVWAGAQESYSAGRWQEAIDQLRQVQSVQADFETDRIEDMLYTAYISLGTEKSNAGSLEEAVNLFDRALALRPQATEIRTVRDVTAQYVDALTYWYADWPRVISLLEDLYRHHPDYRDVQQRLQRAHLEYADSLARQSDWCSAAAHYEQAIAVEDAPELAEKWEEFQTLCQQAPDVSDSLAGTPGDLASGGGAQSTGSTPLPGSLGIGRILYSSRDPVDQRYRIYAQPVTASVRPVVLAEDGMQPSLRPDGRRLAFRSTQGDKLGLGSEDPGTGLRLRFTTYAEDSLPSWNPEGNRLVFGSDREGDRRWRIYTVWAEENGSTNSLVFGQEPEWHPGQDQIVYRGCDDQGNRCGLWTMTSGAANRQPLTTVPGDGHPAWSPDGRYVVFMSQERDGNWEVYRIDVATGTLVRLTDNPANDGLPTVSPDGSRVAFLSDRDGAWRIWVMPLTGGQAQPLAPIQGELPNWLEQDLQWVE